MLDHADLPEQSPPVAPLVLARHLAAGGRLERTDADGLVQLLASGAGVDEEDAGGLLVLVHDGPRTTMTRQEPPPGTVRRASARYVSRLMTARELLIQLDPWLDRRCSYLAARLPGLDADEVYQRVVEEFLEKIERWLQQDARVDVVAQAKSLMTFCLRHVETDEVRERRRRRELPDDEDGDALEPMVDPVAPADHAAARELLAQVRASTSPPCALCLLSLRLPAEVGEADAERAKAWRKGGSNAVPRPVPEAWDMYASGLARPWVVADDIAWKDHVGIAWYTEGAVDALTETDRQAAAAKVERYANRGAEDLRQVLLATKAGP